MHQEWFAITLDVTPFLLLSESCLPVGHHFPPPILIFHLFSTFSVSCFISPSSDAIKPRSSLSITASLHLKGWTSCSFTSPAVNLLLSFSKIRWICPDLEAVKQRSPQCTSLSVLQDHSLPNINPTCSPSDFHSTRLDVTIGESDAADFSLPRHRPKELCKGVASGMTSQWQLSISSVLLRMLRMKAINDLMQLCNDVGLILLTFLGLYPSTRSIEKRG